MPRGDEAARSDAPAPISGVDIRTLPIGPTEAFVMSRVDGRARPEQIAVETGLDRNMVQQALERLAELGAVRFGTAKPAVAPAPEKSAPVQVSYLPDDGESGGQVAAGAPPLPVRYSSDALDAPGDLSREQKKLVLDHFHNLEVADHYLLLGVARDADRSAIRAAYNQKVAVLHPDKYFRRELEGFAPMLASVFKSLTEAHDVLSRKKRRAEYDTYLESRQVTHPYERNSRSGEHRVRVQRIQQEIDDEARKFVEQTAAARPEPRAAAAPTQSASPHEPSSPRVPTPRPVSNAPSEPRTSSAPRISSPPLSPEERKRAAARRFGSSVAPAAGSSRPPATPPSDPGATRVSQKLAVESIRKAYEAKVLGSSQSRVAHYVTQADDADAAGDPLSAANALRLAASLAPDDEALAARLQATELAAAMKLAPKYLEQGTYQEGRGEFAEAAASFEKALRGRPEDAALHARVAGCYLQEGKSLKRAAELARRAVDLAPDTASYRIMLGKVYARAGMIQSALAELERAKMLAPGDDTIKQLIKQIRRGDD